MRKAWLILVVCLGASAAEFPILVKGSDEASFVPTALNKTPISDKRPYDAIVVGGGLAGLSSAVYLTDAGKRVLVLEKEPEFGGLAAGGRSRGVRWGRGASYWTRAYDEELQILRHIGLGDYQTKFPIHEPSDSYFEDGELYLGIWEEATLKRLHPSFELFKFALTHADASGQIPNQPLEEAADTSLDGMNGAEWIRAMPSVVEALNDRQAVRVHQRLVSDPATDPKDPMKPVLGLMELYCRSALGTTPDKISAIALANFYISEIETRYTTETGTGGAAERMVAMLEKRTKAVLRAGATVTSVVSGRGKAEVRWISNRKLFSAKAPFVVYAMPLKFAPKLIAGLSYSDPARVKLIDGLQYAHYNVHNVLLKGHPYRATYDTWTRARNYKERDFTDLILGRWMDPEIRGYEGMRGFERDPKDDQGVFSLYQALPLAAVNKGYSEDFARREAEYSVNRMLELYGPLLAENWGTRIEIDRVETSRWPYSIHLAVPGHFKRIAKRLRRPYGRIFFATNNVGTPTFEEALFRGHCAANNILSRARAGFTFEPWSRCPRE